MPARYRILDEPRYLHVRFIGQVTLEECLENCAALSADEAFFPAIPTLAEFGPGGALEAESVTSEQLDAFTRTIEKTRRGVAYRLAAAGGSADARACFSMGQEMASTQVTYRSFAYPDEALDWLLSTVEARR